ncbi:cobyric acid synthase [Aeribacillus sp. FSL M8-0235]|uniref:cobyric acid synthase n=1 Tax=Aeribacillus sp. FSL M8-0235 TaxID=2954576 RepID=UPI0030F864AC
MNKALPIMIQGTHSDAGKSVIATGFCRIFAQDGYRTAPFKSQNMSLNSYITVDGKEIGRAQGVQAEAARTVATADMNPILIKPVSDHTSQIVVNGKPYQNYKAAAYRQEFFELGLQVIKEAYHHLASTYERIVIEGAGSPAEINLNDRELVNMRIARLTNAPVILVGDIDRGGVFASLVGTLQLLEPEDRDRVIGVVINKFRGDISLLEPGIRWFEEYTGKPVLGVVPYISNLNIEAEDAVILDTFPRTNEKTSEIDIAVIHVPHISNFTDVDPFLYEKDCHVRYVKEANELREPDVVILPGTKNTIEDLLLLRKSGFEDAIEKLYRAKKSVIVGICGGYQMLGREISDPHHVETTIGSANGFGFFPIRTAMMKEKRTTLTTGMAHLADCNMPVEGYEIHMGTTSYEGDVSPFITTEEGVDGCISQDSLLIGTYFHGIFHNDEFRTAFLNLIRKRKGLPAIYERPSMKNIREEAFDRLADCLRKHVDIEFIYREMERFQSKSFF